jgi:alkanesulfonate monooxygenase SsuD/methylene tetrahydromethanopterin reductase-like flavin-dependent oxidoreductase (luciferase family)
MTGDFPLLGFGLPVSGRWATSEVIGRIAGRAEEFGYASLWTFQRVLYPATGELGPAHRSVLDPVVPLALVAGHTDRIRLGTATICAPFTAPALLAKSLTSLDVLSGGRLIAGLGMGWLPQEYAAAGVPYGHNNGGPAVLEDVGDLVAVQASVDRDGHETGVPDGEQRFEILGPVAHHDGNPVTGRQAEVVTQAGGRGSGPGGERGPARVDALAVGECRVIGPQAAVARHPDSRGS